MKNFFISLVCLCITTPAFALKVLTIKNNRVILELENGESVNVSDKFMARDGNGKAKALVEIQQVKGNKALGNVLKGKMQNDVTFTPYTGGNATASGSSSGGGKKSSKRGTSAGIMVGYAMNTMTVKPSNAASISLSGSSFALSGMYQMTIDGGFGARFLAGYETLVAKGDASTAICTGSTSCEVDLSYLGVEALVKYSFIQNSTMDMYAGAGLGFLVAMSKSSNILDTSKISTNQTIVGSLGLDWHLSPTSFIPLQFDYAVYPDNATSSATQMILRAGYGFAF